MNSYLFVIYYFIYRKMEKDKDVGIVNGGDICLVDSGTNTHNSSSSEILLEFKNGKSKC